MNDEEAERPDGQVSDDAGGAGDADRAREASRGLIGALLPIGVILVGLGLVQGFGTTTGTAFVILGLALLTVSLSLVAIAVRGGAKEGAGPEEPGGPDGPGAAH